MQNVLNCASTGKFSPFFIWNLTNTCIYNKIAGMCLKFLKFFEVKIFGQNVRGKNYFIEIFKFN